MWSKHNFINIILVLLLIQIYLVAGRTVLQRKTEIDPEGEKHTKTWTAHEADDDFPTSDGAEDDGFQTFTRNGITLRIKPQTTTLRIGGKNVSPDQLLEQAKHAKELELLAVRQLLSTGHPVKRTSFENGRKHTSTYTLEPDGSIVCKKVEDIDLAEVERRFEEIQKQQQAQHNPNKLSDWQWEERDKPKAETPVHQQATQANKPNQTGNPTPSPQGNQSAQLSKDHQPAEPREAPFWQPPAVAKHPDNIFGDGGPSFSHYPQLPKTWNRNTWDKDDPFNPSELPSFKIFDENFDYEPLTPVGQTNTFTSTHTDNDGNTVRTSYTAGPNEWKRKTVKISTNFHPTEMTTVRTQTLPNLENFLKSQYDPSKESKPLPPSPIAPTSTTLNPVKTINIEDLPPVAVLNINKPAGEQFLQPLGPNTGDQKLIKTLKMDNIQPSPDVGDQRVERTKVRTITKTVHSNQAPSAADLDPNMLDILQRAGINPDEITNANGKTITKTRVEPDGRVVTTTYRVRPTYSVDSYEPVAPGKPSYVASYPDSPFATRSPYEWPPIFSSSLPSKHHSASHFGVDFTPFAAGPLNETNHTTTPKTVVRDREPLEPQHEDEEDTATLNPLHIHPIDPAVPASGQRTVKNAIAEFLAKIGISVEDLTARNGEFVKTIVDDDGRVLTARFVLSAPVSPKYDK